MSFEEIGEQFPEARRAFVSGSCMTKARRTSGNSSPDTGTWPRQTSTARPASPSTHSVSSTSGTSRNWAVSMPETGDAPPSASRTAGVRRPRHGPLVLAAGAGPRPVQQHGLVVPGVVGASVANLAGGGEGRRRGRALAEEAAHSQARQPGAEVVGVRVEVDEPHPLVAGQVALHLQLRRCTLEEGEVEVGREPRPALLQPGVVVGTHRRGAGRPAGAQRAEAGRGRRVRGGAHGPVVALDVGQRARRGCLARVLLGGGVDPGDAGQAAACARRAGGYGP